MKYSFYFVILLNLFLASCEQKTKDSNGHEALGKIDSTSQTLHESHDVMHEIENNLASLHEVRSLRWEKTVGDNSEFLEVHAYMNDEGIPSKIVEYFSMGNFKEQGERHYYFVDSSLIAVIKKADVWIDSNTFMFQENQTFYENDKPVQSRTRSAEYLDEIDEAAWKNIRPISHATKLKKVNDILKGQGKFKTHFISVIKGQEHLFLLLGEPKSENRYVTTVLADHRVPFVNNLLHNLEAYKFRPIDIKFQVIGGDGRPEFRMLTSAKWAD